MKQFPIEISKYTKNGRINGLEYINTLSIALGSIFIILMITQFLVIKNILLAINEENVQQITKLLSFIPLLLVFVLNAIIIKISKVINSYSWQYERDTKYFKEVEVATKEKIEKNSYDNLVLKNQVRNYEIKASEHRKEIEYLNTKIQIQKGQLFKLESDLELSKAKEDISEDVDTLNNVILSLMEEKEALSLLLDSQKQLLENFQLQEEQKNKNTEDLVRQIESGRSTQLKLKEKIKNLELESQGNKDKIKQLEKEKQATYIRENLSAATEIEQLELSLDHTNKEIKELKKVIRLKDKEIKVLNKKIVSTSKSKDSLLAGVIEKSKTDSKIRQVLHDKGKGYNVPFEKVFWEEQEESEEE